MVTLYKTALNDEHLPVLVAERKVGYQGQGRTKVNSPQLVAKLLMDGLNHHRETEEIMYMLCCDASGRVVGLFEISHGGQSSAQVEISSCMKKALLSGASSVIFAHNHPSGELIPSEADYKTNEKLKKACELLDLKYLDFMIIGNGEYVSYNENGYL